MEVHKKAILSPSHVANNFSYFFFYFKIRWNIFPYTILKYDQRIENAGVSL